MGGGWTEQDLRDLELRRANEPAAAKPAPPKRSKFGNEWTEVDGVRFQSGKEAEAYLRLKALERGHCIQRLELQPKFQLIPKFESHGEKYRSIHYIGDFSFWVDGVRHVVDTKSKPTQTPAWKIKWRLAIRQNPEIHFEVW